MEIGEVNVPPLHKDTPMQTFLLLQQHFYLIFSFFTLGDGTMLLVASKVFDKNKPVIGVNTDPER